MSLADATALGGVLADAGEGLDARPGFHRELRAVFTAHRR